MYKLALLFLVLAYVSARFLEKDGVCYKDPLGLEEKPTKPLEVCLADSKDKIWVLDFDEDLEFKHLRSPDKMDRRAFREIVEPTIKYYKQQQILNETNDKPKTDSDALEENNIKKEKTEEMTKYDIKKAIKLMLNKFVLGYKDDVSVYLQPDDSNKVSLKLYFKGPFTSLIVRYKNRRWNYFIQPPSSLPRWFYEKHNNTTRSGKAMYISIPESVRSEFYGKLFHMLRSFLSFAI